MALVTPAAGRREVDAGDVDVQVVVGGLVVEIQPQLVPRQPVLGTEGRGAAARDVAQQRQVAGCEIPE